MRARLILLVLAILLVAGFAAQNWTEFNKPSTLNLGVTSIEAPLGLIMLIALGVALLVFIAAAASLRTRSLIESRQQARALHAQRELADKAEASRFTDLRQMLDTHLRETRQRDGAVNGELQKALVQHQRELRNQLEQMYHLLTSRLTELERRLDSRSPQRVVDATLPGNADATPVTPRMTDATPVQRERV
jgi:uncharacterized integral membrane protein